MMGDHGQRPSLDDGSLIRKGSLPIVTLERAIGVDIEDMGVGSIGGLIMQVLGDVPEEGQRIGFGHFDIVVKKMNGPRIVLVRVFPRDQD
ncbi:transporter associated domain-containing protein [Denitromonas sp.]|uniref:transporter associated domain-containing protein n=1 Tax=Denitromonas sp. TaxID=2734609 RepID=UPI002AFF80C7|nr:transporter associated domain-containing protein [Denitromonas sp.]